MRIQRRAIRAVILCGLWLFTAAATASAQPTERADVRSRPAVRVAAPSTLRSALPPAAAARLRNLRSALREARAASPELRRIERVASHRPIWLTLAGVGLAFGALVFAGRRRRGHGDLTIRLEFPDSIEGEFEIALHRKPNRSQTSQSSGKPWGRKTATHRKPARHTRSGVRREAQFQKVVPGVWFATIDGSLRSPGSGTELAVVAEEIQVRVIARRMTPVDFTLPAIEVPIRFRIQWDGKRARDIGLGVRGQPSKLRYGTRGSLRMALGLGRHEVVIGGGDRVVERAVEINDYEPATLTIDLATNEGIVFKGCPPAVAPFLQGDLGGAARALERDGQNAVASALLAELYQEQGQPERAAEALEQAGRVLEAARLHRELSDYESAAALYERAGELREAAEMYEAAGSPAEAGSAYAAIEAWADASRCFEAAGDANGLIDALEAQGELVQAAACASGQDDRARAIRLLQKVGPQHADYGRASELLALAFEQEGHGDLAAAALERRLAALGPAESAPELEFHLAELLEEGGEWQRALGVLERLRAEEPTYPNVASRIEGLRKKLYESQRENVSSPFVAPAGATAFVAEQRYEVLEEIGRGGMGLVYRAHDRRLGRDVALKRMPENLRDHSGAISLFLGEAQAAARMNHPNIVTLYDADQDQGCFFITMELLEGLPLNSILEQRGPFGPRDTARLGIKVCSGLQYAHERGIVHRDIKTANLFITREKVLKIMDFGLAKIMEAVRDGGSTLIAGTPFYMAPEQSAGRVVDGRTDLYALGVTLYELSTGRPPFTEGDVAEQHRNAPPPDASAGRPGYPAALARLIQRLMAKSPTDRPASAAEVAGALGTLVDD